MPVGLEGVRGRFAGGPVIQEVGEPGRRRGRGTAVATDLAGGGITPDEKFLAPKTNKFQTELLRKYSFFNYVAKYFGGKEAKLPKDWAPDTQTMNEFHAFLLKENVQFSEGEFAENIDWTKNTLRREMYVTAFGPEEARKVAVTNDPIVLKGVDSIPKAKNLTDTAKKLIVQRMQK